MQTVQEPLQVSLLVSLTPHRDWGRTDPYCRTPEVLVQAPEPEVAHSAELELPGRHHRSPGSASPVARCWLLPVLQQGSGCPQHWNPDQPVAQALALGPVAAHSTGCQREPDPLVRPERLGWTVRMVRASRCSPVSLPAVPLAVLLLAAVLRLCPISPVPRAGSTGSVHQARTHWLGGPVPSEESPEVQAGSAAATAIPVSHSAHLM
jgi:hypothetical protein